MPGGSRPQISVFVGREDVLDAVAGQLAGGNRSYLVDATGPWGIGKTALLEKIKLDHGERYLAVRGDLGQFTPESAPGPASQLSTRQLQCNFDQFCALLIALAEAAGSAAFDGFRTKVEREWARIADAVDRVDMRVDMKVVARRGSEITGSEVANVPDPADTVIRTTITAVRPAVAGHFTEALGAASATARSVLLLDEFDRLSGHPIADWVLELARGLRTTVVVVTTKSDCPELAGDVSRHALPRFKEMQVGRYLDQVAAALSAYTGRPVTLPASVAEELFRVSQGYPQLVGMGADMVVDRLLSQPDQPDLQGIFGDGRGEPGTRVVELVRRLKAEVADPDLKAALDRGWVLRRLDEDVLERVLFAGDDSLPADERRRRAKRTLNDLAGYSFVAPDPSGGYRLQEFVRQALEARMATDPDLPDPTEIHALASGYYRERALGSETGRGDPSSYSAWYRYEDPVWQGLKREWLYHTAAGGRGVDERSAGLALARLFLEAFWWYGSYTYFPFCEQLLDDWERSQPADRHHWSQPLRVLHERYRERSPESWVDVENALLDIRTLAEVDIRPAGELDGDGRRVSAFTSIFLGARYRFAEPPMLEEAEHRYREAYDLLALEHDDVIRSYTALRMAQVAQERGDLAGAFAWCREVFALARASAKPDYELVAALFRLVGALRAEQGEREAAVDAYGRALVAAYMFNGFPHAPDTYTTKFYRDQVERTITDVCRLWSEQDPQVARHACSRLRQAFAGYWRTRADPVPADEVLDAALAGPDVESLARLLFPPAPTDDELGQATSESRRHIQRVALDAGARLLDAEGLLASSP